MCIDLQFLLDRFRIVVFIKFTASFATETATNMERINAINVDTTAFGILKTNYMADGGQFKLQINKWIKW